MSRTSFTEWSLGLVGDVRRRKVEFRRWSTTKSLRQAVSDPRNSGCPQDCSGDFSVSDQNLDSCDLGSQCKLKTLSAESSFDSRSEGSGSSEEEVASPISSSSINWISIRVPKCLLLESIFPIRITSFIAGDDKQPSCSAKTGHSTLCPSLHHIVCREVSGNRRIY